MSKLNKILQFILSNIIIESGYVGDWYYKKYYNGRYEAENIRNIGQVSVNTLFSSVSNIYYSADIYPPSIPCNLIESNVIQYHLDNSVGNCWECRMGSSIRLFRPTSAVLQNVRILTKVSGKWK